MLMRCWRIETEEEAWGGRLGRAVPAVAERRRGGRRNNNVALHLNIHLNMAIHSFVDCSLDDLGSRAEESLKLAGRSHQATPFSLRERVVGLRKGRHEEATVLYKTALVSF